jgi:hypothetical protein
MDPPVRADGMKICRTRTERLVTVHCLVSSAGVVHVAQTGNGELRGTTFRYGSSLSAEERATCDRALATLGFPEGSNTCPGTD